VTFIETLQSHTGGLLRLKSELYWYGGRGYDGNPGQVCLLLDAVRRLGQRVDACSRTRSDTVRAFTDGAIASLLIDGTPQWVWINEKDVELLVNDQPAN
jgi:hypothetical protein